jgi:ATP-dependent RNA helicase DOB1
MRAAPGTKGRSKRGAANGTKGSESTSDIFKVFRMIMERGFDPVIVFSFSKKECEELAEQMAPFDLNDDTEKKLVDSIFSRWALVVDGI